MRILLKNIIASLVVYLLLSAGTFLMIKMILEYTSFKDDVGFLQFKQDHIDNITWKISFYVHVFSAVICLFAGFTQFSSSILKNNKSLHRSIGKVYAYIIFLNFPFAMIMAIYANGGLITKLAFVILDVLWFWFTLKAVIEVKKGNIQQHSQFMIRSFALTLSALALRTWKIILVNTTALDIETIYMIDAWLAFIPNLILAEWIIQRKKTLPAKLNIFRYQPSNGK